MEVSENFYSVSSAEALVSSPKCTHTCALFALWQAAERVCLRVWRERENAIGSWTRVLSECARAWTRHLHADNSYKLE